MAITHTTHVYIKISPEAEWKYYGSGEISFDDRLRMKLHRWYGDFYQSVKTMEGTGAEIEICFEAHGKRVLKCIPLVPWDRHQMQSFILHNFVVNANSDGAGIDLPPVE